MAAPFLEFPILFSIIHNYTPLVGVSPKKYVEDISMFQGKVHANFGLDPSSNLGGEWRQTNRQTAKQKHCFICVDKQKCRQALSIS